MISNSRDRWLCSRQYCLLLDFRMAVEVIAIMPGPTSGHAGSKITAPVLG